MEMDLERIQNIFGKSSISEIRNNKEDFLQNIEYMISLGYKDVYELVQLYPYTFLKENQEFREKVEELLDSLGVESFEKISEDTSIWGRLDE